MLKLIIFDWDDVITIGAKDGYYDCYRKAVESVGITIQDEELDARIKRKWGQPYREELKEILKEYPQLVDRACLMYQEHKLGETFLSKVRLVDGINELLKQLSQKYILAVATANQPVVLEKIFSKFQIPHVFKQIVTAYDKNIPPEKTKPNPFMLNLILKTQHILNTEAVYVGDAENDVQMARNARVEPIVVLTGHLSEQEAKNLKVKWVLSDVTHISDILSSVLERKIVI